jgi:hypothetical protein
MKRIKLAGVAALVVLPTTALGQSIGSTTIMTPLAGRLYTPASGQNPSTIGFWGTDLGWTVKYKNDLRILFGDTWSNSSGALIGLTADDAQGAISATAFPNGNAVDNYVFPNCPSKPSQSACQATANCTWTGGACHAASHAISWQNAGPPVVFRLNFLGKVAPEPLYRGGIFGTLLNMGILRAPILAFANNASTGGGVFAMYHRSVGMLCTNGACANGFSCDTGMGTCNGDTSEEAVGCVLGTSRCACVALASSYGGVCIDPTSSVYDTSEDGRVLARVFRHEVGNADPTIVEQFYTRSWYTNKFINSAARTVENFDPARANGSGNNYAPADGASPMTNEKVFLWGRPNFAGYGSWTDRSDKLYFAYVDMPAYNASGAFAWAPKFFTGLNGSGVPQFSTTQANAVPLDLSGGGGSTTEQYDIVNFMGISWVPAINKFVMLYGGDAPDLFLNFMIGPSYQHLARDPQGAIHARFASQPWGPWSAPVTFFAAGDLTVNPPAAGTQYAPGGILYHPGCSGPNCVPTESNPPYAANEYGRLYAPNVVDLWTTTRGTNTADIYWNVSTWNPSQSVLLRTRIQP